MIQILMPRWTCTRARTYLGDGILSQPSLATTLMAPLRLLTFQPDNPYSVGWIQGSTSSSSDYYMMYYYTTDVKVIEIDSGGNPRHYALVLSYYSSYDTTSYPNGIQVVKLDLYKTW